MAMPYYDYICKKCHHEFEKEYSFTAIKLKNKKPWKPSCPNCKSRHTTRIYGSSSVIYKSSGFYNTDQKGK